MSSAHPMSQSEDLGPSSAECHERLVDQLHTLSQVVETITYRLLELEERLIEQESQLQALDQRAGTSSQLSNGAELRFDATEERLVQLESLLNGLEPVPSAGPSRHLRPVRESHRPDPEPDQELPSTAPSWRSLNRRLWMMARSSTPWAIWMRWRISLPETQRRKAVSQVGGISPL
jgi:hypothetical protein